MTSVCSLEGDSPLWVSYKSLPRGALTSQQYFLNHGAELRAQSCRFHRRVSCVFIGQKGTTEVLVKSSLEVAFPDGEPQKCQYSCGHRPRDSRLWSQAKGFKAGAWMKERQLNLILCCLLISIPNSPLLGRRSPFSSTGAGMCLSMKSLIPIFYVRKSPCCVRDSRRCLET